MTVTPYFDPHANHGLGEAGFLATTAAGISRFGVTREDAIRRALAQQEAYAELSALATA